MPRKFRQSRMVGTQRQSPSAKSSYPLCQCLPMSSHLLSLALTVEQHGEADFSWVILESFDFSNTFEVLMESVHGFRTYIEALDAGHAAIKLLSTDLDIGPREEIPDDCDFCEDTNSF